MMKQSSYKAVMLLVMVLMWPGVTGAENKKDVADPVLQEVISLFSLRMPRFIDKHGGNIFIADETLTRGSFMLALYEYDKSLKINKKDFVNRQEFEEILNKVSSLENRRSVAATLQRAPAATVDIAQIINDLQPNMPILLDNSLENSKVFNNLKNEIMLNRQDSVSVGMRTGGAYDNSALLQLTRRIESVERSADLLDETQRSMQRDSIGRQDLEEIRLKLAKLEKSSYGTRYTGYSQNAPDDLRDSVSLTRQDIAKLARRVEDIESKNYSERSLSEKNAVLHEEVDIIQAKIARLEKNIESQSPKSGGSVELKNNLAQTQAEIARLNRKLDELYALARTPSETNKGSAQWEQEITRLKRRVGELEKGRNYAGKEPSSDLKHYASALTKISLGLGLVAAFFIAR